MAKINKTVTAQTSGVGEADPGDMFAASEPIAAKVLERTAQEQIDELVRQNDVTWNDEERSHAIATALAFCRFIKASAYREKAFDFAVRQIKQVMRSAPAIAEEKCSNAIRDGGLPRKSLKKLRQLWLANIDLLSQSRTVYGMAGSYYAMAQCGAMKDTLIKKDQPDRAFLNQVTDKIGILHKLVLEQAIPSDESSIERANSDILHGLQNPLFRRSGELRKSFLQNWPVTGWSPN